MVVGREFGASVVGLLFSGLGIVVGELVGTSEFGGSVTIGIGAPDGAGVGSLLDGPGDGARLSISAGEKVGKVVASASEDGAPLGISGQASRIFAEALGLEED